MSEVASKVAGRVKGKVTVKICGLMSEKDILTCVDCNVDIIGLVTEYPVPVQWNLSVDEAVQLAGLVNTPSKICVVTGGEPERVVETAKKVNPAFVQLHYNETFSDTVYIANALREWNIGVIKAFPVGEYQMVRQFGTKDIGCIAGMINDTDIFGVLVDQRTPDNLASGKPGISADTELFRRIKQSLEKPVFIAGGITPENVSNVLKESDAEFIDVLSGVEKSAGIKDALRIKKLMNVIKHY